MAIIELYFLNCNPMFNFFRRISSCLVFGKIFLIFWSRLALKGSSIDLRRTCDQRIRTLRSSSPLILEVEFKSNCRSGLIFDLWKTTRTLCFWEHFLFSPFMPQIVKIKNVYGNFQKYSQNAHTWQVQWEYD